MEEMARTDSTVRVATMRWTEDSIISKIFFGVERDSEFDYPRNLA